QHGRVKRRGLELQMPVPGEGHENVGGDEKQDRQDLGRQKGHRIVSGQEAAISLAHPSRQNHGKSAIIVPSMEALMRRPLEKEWELTIDPDTVRLFILKA